MGETFNADEKKEIKHIKELYTQGDSTALSDELNKIPHAERFKLANQAAYEYNKEHHLQSGDKGSIVLDTIYENKDTNHQDPHVGNIRKVGSGWTSDSVYSMPSGCDSPFRSNDGRAIMDTENDSKIQGRKTWNPTSGGIIQ